MVRGVTWPLLGVAVAVLVVLAFLTTPVGARPTAQQSAAECSIDELDLVHSDYLGDEATHVTIANGTAYALNNVTLFAYDLTSGTRLGSVSVPTPDYPYYSFFQRPPRVSNDTVYAIRKTGSQEQRIYAFDRDSHTLRWSHRTDGQGTTMPRLYPYRGDLYVHSDTAQGHTLYRYGEFTGEKSPVVPAAAMGTFRALDATSDGLFVTTYQSTYKVTHDGQIRWSADVPSTAPTLTDRGLYVIANMNSAGAYAAGPHLIRYAPTSGIPEWETSVAVNMINVSSVKITHDTAYIVSREQWHLIDQTPDAVYGYNLSTGEQTVSYTFGDGPPTHRIRGECLAVGQPSGRLVMRTLATGEQTATQQLPPQEPTRPAIGESAAAVGTEHGNFYILRAASGATPPAVVGDTPPTDPDGDGLYEDVNGDGDVTPGDATVLFGAAFEGTPAVTENVPLYDFNDDGDLTPGDATVLFEESF